MSSIPSGATVTSAQLVINGATTGAAGGLFAPYVSDFRVTIMGAGTLAEKVLANVGQATNGGPYSNTLESLGNGAFTVQIKNNGGHGNLTINSVQLVYTYSIGASADWYDAITGGTLLGSYL